MELKDFIKNALLSVVNGVEEANVEKNRFKLNNNRHDNGESGQQVEFDISVIAEKSSGNSANGGLKVAIANLGGEHKKSESNQNAHRMKFTVFISEG